MSVTMHVGDVRAVLATLEPGSVDLVLSSPPFLGLRSYLDADDPAKVDEIGSEATPAEFIDTLLDVVEACERVLAPHGTLAFELGDTYAGSGGAGGDYNAGGLRDGQAAFSGSATQGRRSRAQDEARGILSPHKRPGPEGRDKIDGWPLDKSLCLIPESFRWALVYGRNPFNGRPTPRWRARNVIRWVRPNPPVGALGDKFRPATSDMVVVCKGRQRYFDLDAVRTEHKRSPDDISPRHGEFGDDGRRAHNHGRAEFANGGNPAGAPPLDWWKISPSGYPGSHYATFPPELCVVPVKAMSPERVCTTCGKPSERITATEQLDTGRTTNGRKPNNPESLAGTKYATRTEASVTTLGWTDCGHGAWRAGRVLDPFGGTGTTALVAAGHGRDAVLVDLDRRNVDLAYERLGMLLTEVVFHDAVEAAS